ncbi:MAG: phosphatidylethanolamine N-methyltransferase family protein [Hyphomicrobiales bacterium]|nr:phosphatidylethanolamine N-methyltransferase family protein [Hyphomicrobiales bacterium]
MTKIETQEGSFFEGQFAHLVCTAILLLALYAASRLQGFSTGSFLGLSTTTWAIFAVANAILHQVYVWLCWRSELNGQHLTRIFGDRAFGIYQAGFAILIIARPVLAFALGWSNRGSLPIEPGFGYLISLLLLAPVIYLAYCVHRYFGFERAFGIDHFDASSRNLALVREGIFTWTPNAMYVFGFLFLWVPAFLFQSVAALAVAAFSHAYIWVHYYCTEKPDMRRIYG